MNRIPHNARSYSGETQRTDPKRELVSRLTSFTHLWVLTMLTGITLCLTNASFNESPYVGLFSSSSASPWMTFKLDMFEQCSNSANNSQILSLSKPRGVVARGVSTRLGFKSRSTNFSIFSVKTDSMLMSDTPDCCAI